MSKPRLTATEKIIIETGHRQAYQPAVKDNPITLDRSRLTRLRRGQRVKPRRVMVQHHVPPQGMSEAELIRSLQLHDIGRPATYASITAALLQREYAHRNSDGQLLPTGRGRAVWTFLEQTYPDLFDPVFTAQMERSLDAIAEGQATYQETVRVVWEMVKTKKGPQVKES